jgi:hypothetical protein
MRASGRKTFFDLSNDPFAVDGQELKGPYPLFNGVGSAEWYPGAWLLSYWMARHEGIIAAPGE